MNKCFCSFVFILGLTVAYAPAQTPSQSQSTETGQPGPSSTNGQSSAVTPAQNTSSTTIPGGTTDASGAAAVTGSATANTGGNPQSAAASPSQSDLQSQIQQALNKEPTLAGEQVNVTVSGPSIDLSGRVGNAKQKLTATRIVESFAENRKVVNNLTIGSTSGNTAAQPAGESGHGANRPGNPDLSSHPEPEKGSTPETSTRPPQ